MKHSTGKPTKYEQQRIDAMLRFGCAALAQLGIWHVAEVHHIVEGNRRLGHWYTLPLSPAVHRGIWTPELIEIIPPDMRVSIADGSKAFERVFGTERDLWMKVQVRLGLPALWPISKRVPREGVRYVESNKNLVARNRDTSIVSAHPENESRGVQTLESGHGASVSGTHGPGAGGEAP